MECFSFDVEVLGDSSISVAALCSEDNRDLLVLLNSKNSSGDSMQTMPINYNFDYVEMKRVSKEQVLFLLFDDRTDRLDIYSSKSNHGGTFDSSLVKSYTTQTFSVTKVNGKTCLVYKDATSQKLTSNILHDG